MSMLDAVLLERWQRRQDADAFTELVQRHSGMVFACCGRILGEQALAEDVAQECFIALMQSRERVRGALSNSQFICWTRHYKRFGYFG